MVSERGMILDSSAIIAILLCEPQATNLMRRMHTAPILAVAAPTLLQSAMVLSSRIPGDTRQILNEFLREFEVEVIAFSRDHHDAAVDAFYRFGKGRHPAALNFGDCMSYAAASLSGLPLLFVGDDFSKTDLQTVG
jgi:ribonuclease VapC